MGTRGIAKIVRGKKSFYFYFISKDGYPSIGGVNILMYLQKVLNRFGGLDNFVKKIDNVTVVDMSVPPTPENRHKIAKYKNDPALLQLCSWSSILDVIRDGTIGEECFAKYIDAGFIDDDINYVHEDIDFTYIINLDDLTFKISSYDNEFNTVGPLSDINKLVEELK